MSDVDHSKWILDRFGGVLFSSMLMFAFVANFYGLASRRSFGQKRGKLCDQLAPPNSSGDAFKVATVPMPNDRFSRHAIMHAHMKIHQRTKPKLSRTMNGIHAITANAMAKR